MKIFQCLFAFYALALIPAEAGWAATGSMSYQNRFDHTSTLLKDGRVLVTGGRTSYNNYTALNSAEIYNPITNQWLSMPPMASNRVGHTATLLDDGRVIVIGGAYDNSITSAVEIFDPNSGQWVKSANLNKARTRHLAQLLPNSKILIAAGSDGIYSYVNITEIYDPYTGISTNVSGFPGPMEGELKSVLLSTNTVLCASSARQSLLFDPNFNSWSYSSPMPTSGLAGDPVLLMDNRVLIAGGWTGTSGYVDMTYLYDPNSGLWSSSGNLNQRRGDHQTTSLKTGKVLITGGQYGGEFLVRQSSTEIYNSQTGVWTYGEPMLSARSRHKATMLKDGRVLVTGGSDNPPEIYSYAPELISHPSSQNQLQQKSVILSVSAGGGGTLTYQWKKDGVDIPNSNSENLKLSNLQLTDAGSYTVVVTNSEGSVTSESAILTVTPDSDGDGLSDADETGIYNTDPNNPDSDGDGLSDYAEIQNHGTNPLLADSDGDGFSDAYELQTGKSPNDADDKPSLVAEVRTAVEVSFPSSFGKTYRIEGSSDLGTWSTIEDAISGTGAGITRFYSTRDNPARFFRIEESDSP